LVELANYALRLAQGAPPMAIFELPSCFFVGQNPQPGVQRPSDYFKSLAAEESEQKGSDRRFTHGYSIALQNRIGRRREECKFGRGQTLSSDAADQRHRDDAAAVDRARVAQVVLSKDDHPETIAARQAIGAPAGGGELTSAGASRPPTAATATIVRTPGRGLIAKSRAGVFRSRYFLIGVRLMKRERVPHP